MAGESTIWAMGMMSGTSLDGVDAALVHTDGEQVDAFGPTLFRPYSDAERETLRRALDDAAAIVRREDRPAAVAAAEALVTDVHVAVAHELAAVARHAGIRPAVIGFHGQTVLHAPDRGITVQVGDGEALSMRTGVPVVHDLRAADVAAGGQGAPLVPVWHRALIQRAGLTPPVAFLNVGGVANVTLVARDGSLSAFDTGPGNAIMDDILFRETGERFDRDGQVASRGTADDALVEAIVEASDYLRQPPPKSLDRASFPASLIDVPGMALADRLATASRLTAVTVARALRFAHEPPSMIVVSGGGAHNANLLSELAAATGLPVTTAAAHGLDTDFIEAQAFGFLAVRRLRGLPSSFPGTTGAPHPVVGGIVATSG
jgi:anhydro-N-acetylmuramic acid kinase